MDQNNGYYDMDAYQKNGKQKKEHDAGAFLGGLVTGMLITMLLVGVMACIAVMVGRVKQNGNASAGNGSGTAGQASASEEIVSQEKETKETKENGKFMTSRIETKINKLANLIGDEFFLNEVTDEELETGLYRGLLSSLGDVYSEYYTPEEFQELMTDSSGIYFGIGAYVSMDKETNLPKISGVFKNSPAEEAGLRTDDIIYMVDGELTYGLTLSEAVSRIRGEEYTQVMLTIVRDGEQLEKQVTRRQVEHPTVESEMLSDGMGYLRIVEFDTVTSAQFLEAMDELYSKGMKGLILDLRGNPGGNLSTVVEIAQNLLPKGLIVYTEDKEKHREEYKCKGDKEIQIPMVVLVDSNSASAAEILSGAIQDYGKGTLIGTKTYGKGIVQSIIPLRDGSAIKITTSGYFTPNGRNIHKIGIEPDIVCEFDGELYYDTKNPIDNQLEKAKEVLAGKMK